MITNLAFSDDVNILAGSTTAALNQLAVFKQFLEWSGMTGAFDKFEAVGYWKVGGKIEIFDPKLTFDGLVIKYAFEKENSNYSGKTTFMMIFER